MLLGLEWFLDTPTGLTALLMMLCAFFAAAYQWGKTGKKIDDTGYVLLPSGPLGIFKKKVPLRRAPKETLEAIIADMKAHNQKPPQAVLDALYEIEHPEEAGKHPDVVQGDPAQADLPAVSGGPAGLLAHETKDAQNPIEHVDPELAAMLNLNALPAGQPLQTESEKETPSLSAPPQAPSRRYRCKFCPKVYDAANSLSMHMARTHPKEYAKQLKARSK